jgi:predicted nuclease of predicted toxin-antitoxin system
MNFLIDECVGHGVAQWLRNQGYDVVSILEVSPGISDDAVLSKAFNENRILITMDKDFGDIVFRSNKDHCGIILLRLSNWQIEHKVSVLENVLAHHMHELEDNFIVVTEQAVRIVRLSKLH